MGSGGGGVLWAMVVGAVQYILPFEVFFFFNDILM